MKISRIVYIMCVWYLNSNRSDYDNSFGGLFIFLMSKFVFLQIKLFDENPESLFIICMCKAQICEMEFERRLKVFSFLENNVDIGAGYKS